MASVTHLAAGAVCAAVYSRVVERRSPVAVAAFALLALSPDIDLVALELGSRGTPLDHRAMTHSLLFAVVAGSVLGALLTKPLLRLRAAALSVAALASHGVLDAMTAHGPGPQLFWPLSTTPIQLAWRPIPGVDSYQEYFTPQSMPVVAAEAVLCLPLLLAAALVWFGPLRRRTERA